MNRAIHMGHWTGPTTYPAAALETTSTPVTAMAASGATWRQSNPDAAATARRTARTSPGRYTGSAVWTRTHSADAAAIAPASHTSARAGAHGRRPSAVRPVRADDDTSHRASARPPEATPAGVVMAASREGGEAAAGGGGAPAEQPQGGAARPRRGSWPVPARHEAEALAHRRRHPTAARGPGDPRHGRYGAANRPAIDRAAPEGAGRAAGRLRVPRRHRGDGRRLLRDAVPPVGVSGTRPA